MSKPLHIAFLTPEYPHEKVKFTAGIGTSVKNLAIALVQKGVKVTVFVYGQKNSEVVKENGLSIHIIPHKKYKFLGWYFYRKHIEKYINSVVKTSKIDVLEAPDWTGVTAFMNFKVPLVIRFHGTDAYFCRLENRPQKKKNFFFEKQALKNATAYISPTKFTANITADIFRLDITKIKTIYHGIDISKFRNPNFDKFNQKSLLYVGTIIRKKGVLELAKIMSRLAEEEPDIMLTLIGSDSFDIQTNSPSTLELMKKEMSRKAINQTNYVGRVPYSEVQKYIKEAHVCLFPTFAETFGMVTIEAMAMQKAVVNSNIGWSNELIEDGVDGFLVHPTNTEEYVTKIKQLFSNIEQCITIGANANKTVYKKFNIDTQVVENINFYQKVINDYTIS